MSIEKPPCYGRPCVAPTSPCRSCGVLAACGRRLSQTSPFGLLMYPRIDPPVSAGGDELPAPVLFNADIEREIAEALSVRACLTPIGKGRVWKWRRERVAVLIEASAARVAIELPLVGPARVSMMASVRGAVQVAALLTGPPSEGNVTQGQIAERRANATGSVVWASAWEPVVAVVTEVAAAVFQGGSA